MFDDAAHGGTAQWDSTIWDTLERRRGSEIENEHERMVLVGSLAVIVRTGQSGPLITGIRARVVPILSVYP